MEEFRLARTDNRPLVFHGQEIAHASTKTAGSTRWDIVRVFKMEAGGFIIGIARLTCWDGERDRYTAHKCKSIDKVIGRLKLEAPALEGEIKSQIENEGSVQQSRL